MMIGQLGWEKIDLIRVLKHLASTLPASTLCFLSDEWLIINLIPCKPKPYAPNLAIRSCPMKLNALDKSIKIVPARLSYLLFYGFFQ